MLVESPLSSFDWKIPMSCPIEIPSKYDNGYSRNVFLKENFGAAITNDKSLNCYYWLIQEWGGIRSFKRNEKNDQRINRFLRELGGHKLIKNSFECISSLSKIAAFINPENYATYDSRAIYTLNWLLFNSGVNKLFSQPVDVVRI